MDTYLRLRKRVHSLFDDHAHHGSAKVVTILLVTVISISILIVILSSVQELMDRYGAMMHSLDYAIMFVFIAEYLLRLWSCVEDERYKHPLFGRIKYVFSPLTLIDLVAILPTLLTGIGVDLRSLRIARLLRLARALKIVRYVSALHVIGKVISIKKHQLATSLMFVTFMLVISSTLMYEFEHDVQPDKFESIPATMWWSVATLTTVGYGDVYPITVIGKLLAAVSAVLGIGLFAIPTGILASGFSEIALEVSEAERVANNRCEHCGKELPLS